MATKKKFKGKRTKSEELIKSNKEVLTYYKGVYPEFPNVKISNQGS